MEVALAILAFLLGISVSAVIYLIRRPERHPPEIDVVLGEESPDALGPRAATTISPSPQASRAARGVGRQDEPSQPQRRESATLVSPRDRSAANRMSQENLYDIERPHVSVPTADRKLGPVEPEVEETLRFLEEITPVAEMWGTPSPWYQRSDWEDSAKLQYDATDYDWAFYATVQRTSYVGEMQRDHLVSLSEAHASGGCEWTASRKREFANDVTNIFLVPAPVNRQKHHHDPTEWRPANVGIWRRYAVEWVKVKRKWNLNIDAAELEFLRWMLVTPSE